ncbi:YncE family protein [Devosia alba]|uniref:YncE family protein n=1 Tax=Devosia alba TaxID=3152360 RepID=UPI003262ED05
MKRLLHSLLTTSILALAASSAQAEQTALVLYETKGQQAIRQEGIAFVELDPVAPDYGKILAQIPLPPDLISHHIFYNPARDRAYVTSLGRSELRVLDVTSFPYRAKVVAVPGCVVGEDVAFSEAQNRWYLTCMGSSVVIVGDATTDEMLDTIALPAPYPHGITVHDGIDRMLVTSTINPKDPTDAGESIVVIQPSTGEVLSTHKVSDKPSPSGTAPVEAFFVPGAEPPVAYITNMNEGRIWIAEWQPESETFSFRGDFDFTAIGQGVALEVYFNAAGDRAYVTTALPGHLNAFDISDPRAPKHLYAVEAAGGAHHLVFSPDGNRAYVQNSLINIPGTNDGSISVIDLVEGAKVGSIDTFKDAGLTVNTIMLTPEAEDFHAH